MRTFWTGVAAFIMRIMQLKAVHTVPLAQLRTRLCPFCDNRGRRHWFMWMEPLWQRQKKRVLKWWEVEGRRNDGATAAEVFSRGALNAYGVTLLLFQEERLSASGRGLVHHSFHTVRDNTPGIRVLSPAHPLRVPPDTVITTHNLIQLTGNA